MDPVLTGIGAAVVLAGVLVAVLLARTRRRPAGGRPRLVVVLLVITRGRTDTDGPDTP